jgi:hypothetical protein
VRPRPAGRGYVTKCVTFVEPFLSLEWIRVVLYEEKVQENDTYKTFRTHTK